MSVGSLAFDIGAHYGRDTEILLELFGRVVAVEPIATHVNELKSRFQTQLGQSLEIVETAVSNHMGHIEIFESDTISTVEPRWITHSRFSATHTWRPGCWVDTVTIDHLVHQYGTPQFIKIDTEAHELEAIQGMSQAYPEIITFEWAEECTDKTLLCLDALQALGYQKFAICEMHDSLYFNPVWYSPQIVSAYLQQCLPGRMTQWGMIWAAK